jgi:hypothetical protein
MSTSKEARARPRIVKWRLPTLVFGLATTSLIFGQRPFREYPGWEYENFPKPPDWRVPGEWTFPRLMYPSSRRIYDRPFTNWIYGDGQLDYRLSAFRSASVGSRAAADAHPDAIHRAARKFG